MIDLQQFCGYSNRYSLTRPWRDGKFVYATDGRILVRVNKRLKPNVAKPNGRVPDCERILRPGKELARWQWLDVPPQQYCKNCNGTGIVPRTCPACDHGWGDVCFQCNVYLGTRPLAQHYVNMIRGLPEARMTFLSGVSDQVFFKFDGGVGLLCVRVVDES